MKTVHQEILEYLTYDAYSPFGEWLNALKDIKAKAKIRVLLDRLHLGNFGDCKSVGEGVQELRIHYGNGYRVYFGRDGNKLILLLCGGTKKTQQKDIRNAKEYWDDYRRRKNE